MSGQRDITNDLGFATSLAPAARTATANGTAIDLAGFNAAGIVWNVGAITDGTHTPTIEESDASGSGFAAVAAADLSTTLAALTANTNQEVSYLGSKRYIRAVITCAGTTTGGVYAALVVKGNARTLPA